MNKLLIKYEPVIDYINVDCNKSLYVMYNDLEHKEIDLYFHDVRFTGWTAVGKIEDDKMYIAFSVCKYEEGDNFVKKIGVEEALKKCTPEKAAMIIDLSERPSDETVKIFHSYVDILSKELERRFYKKRVKYWLSKIK